jgi:drug/metabolite transporter (DMT)-like permease
MNRRSWLLFTATSVIWGSSFLLIRIAVEHMTPSTVVFGRMMLGALFLVPFAARSGGFRGLRRHLPAIIAVTVLDMLLPTLLTAWGEQRISSSAAAILTATDPLFVALIAFWLMRSEAVSRWRLVGLVVGFVGVATLVGADLRGSVGELLGAAAVLASALGYAVSTLIYRRWLEDAPAVGVTAVMLLLTSMATAGPGVEGLVAHFPPVHVALAVAILGCINTGLAYWLYYALINEAGAASAAVITYVMPVVALVLGISFLNEKLTLGAVLGLALVGIGAWLATRGSEQDAGQDGQVDVAAADHRHGRS